MDYVVQWIQLQHSPYNQMIREHCIGGAERFLEAEDQDIWWEIVTSIC